jgi:hypothetical protein
MQPTDVPMLDREDVEQAFDRALARYFAERHARVDAFVDRHFSLRGTLSLHRAALGWDVLRAPANLMLTGPTILLKLGAAGARAAGAKKAGRWLETRNLFLRTAVAGRIEHLIRTDLLELPEPGAEKGGRDPLAEALLEDPAVQAAMAAPLARIAERAGDPTVSGRMAEALSTYVGTRAAASEIATAFVSVAIGAGLFKQLTPGMMSLGPSVAAAMAHQTAIASFPLGASLGGLWYSAFPATASTGLVVGTTAALGFASAGLAAFAGILTDPVQRSLGQHQRRLHRLLDVLEEHLRGRDDVSLKVRDHYVAKLMDLLDYLAIAARVARG